MKNLWLFLAAATLLAVPSLAQTQHSIPATQNDISFAEFRQTVLDLGTYLDAHRGTQLAMQFEAIPDEMLARLYLAVPSPRKLQGAVAALKQHDAEARSKSLAQAQTQAGSNFLKGISPLVVYTDPSCQPPNTNIIDDPPAMCNPAYPDPTNSFWQTMVNPLISVSAFSGLSSSTDYTDASPQVCGLSVETNQSAMASSLEGTVLAASAVCNAVPIGGSFCWAADAVFALSAANAVGLYEDCVEQDNLVNSAKIDAAFHNTVTIYDALGGLGTQLASDTTTITGDISTATSIITGDITSATSTIASDIASSTTTIAGDITVVNNNINAQFMTTDTAIATLTGNVAALAKQLTQTTALLQAYEKAIMRLEMTPNTSKNVIYPILTCTGTNCPNVLQECDPPLANGCSWNKLGPP